MSLSLHDVGTLIAGGGGGFVMLIILALAFYHGDVVAGSAFRRLETERDEWRDRFLDSLEAGRTLERTSEQKEQIIRALLARLPDSSTTHDGDAR